MLKITKKDIKDNRIYQNVDGENYFLRYEGRDIVLLEAIGNRMMHVGKEIMYEKDLFLKYFTLIPKRVK